MLRELQIWWRLRPTIKAIKEVSKMKFSVNALVQLLMLAAQGINQAADLLPPRARFWATVAMAAVQGLVGVLAHFVNPDGTPAEVAYQKR
jgi:hypothetical protein